ncbi:MAG TPA: hypothetical protein PLJ12_14660, partial [Planctomycetota bacterium]|nr:hypothetical protein [Planctomycetota bacterium]
LGTQDNIENGTETFYLLNVPNPLDIADLTNTLYNTSQDSDGDLLTLFTNSPGNFTVIENICMLSVANDPHDVAHDCAATIGPDGTFFPAGIFRPGDYPNAWCGDTWLDFNTPGGPDQTPGSANPSATCAVTVTDGPGCGGGSTNVGTPFCDPMDNNSTGMPTHLTGTMTAPGGSGLHLEANQGPPTQFGYFLVGTAVSDPGLVVSQGRLCLSVVGGNSFGRYNVPGALNSVGQFDAGGVLQNFVSTSTVGSGYDVPVTVPIAGSPQIMAGQTWHFQLWHREDAGFSNFSNGLSVTF